MSESKLLYHYTDAAGLLGIFTPAAVHPMWGDTVDPEGSTTLWASDVRYLNDSKELHYGRATLERLLRERARRGDLPSDREALLDSLASRVRDDSLSVNWGDHVSQIWVYVSCFCTEGDLLSQWRRYGANGGGYAVGFEPEALSTALRFDQQNPFIARQSPKLVKVAYGLQDAETHLRQVVENLALSDEALMDSGASIACMTALAAVKDDAFKDEQEWRLIADASGHDVSEFRPGRTGVLPYVKLCVGAGLKGQSRIRPAAKIVVGPGPEPDLRIDAVRRLTRRHGWTIDIVPSEVPYRG